MLYLPLCLLPILIEQKTSNMHDRDQCIFGNSGLKALGEAQYFLFKDNILLNIPKFPNLN